MCLFSRPNYCGGCNRLWYNEGGSDVTKKCEENLLKKKREFFINTNINSVIIYLIKKKCICFCDKSSDNQARKDIIDSLETVMNL